MNYYSKFKQMTVSQLIEELQKQDGNKFIKLICESESYGMNEIIIEDSQEENTLCIIGI